MLKASFDIEPSGRAPQNLPDNIVRCGPFNSFLRLIGELREMHYGRLFELCHIDRWLD